LVRKTRLSCLGGSFGLGIGSVCPALYARATMDETFFISCASDDCSARIPRATITGATTAGPPYADGFKVPLLRGEWWAYRDLCGDVDRVYCPRHHDLAREVEPRRRQRRAA
jgi:hypothetical protein